MKRTISILFRLLSVIVGLIIFLFGCYGILYFIFNTEANTLYLLGGWLGFIIGLISATENLIVLINNVKSIKIK